MKIQEQPYSIEVNLDDTKIFLGLFSFVSIALIQLMSMNTVDGFLIFAEYCFACSLPFLAILIFIKYAERRKQKWFKSLSYTFVYLTAPLTSIMGIGSIFFHFSSKIGFVFGICAFLSIVLKAKLMSWIKN
jgi:hypothetical protein